jgi:hypothetical protein
MICLLGEGDRGQPALYDGPRVARTIVDRHLLALYFDCVNARVQSNPNLVSDGWALAGIWAAWWHLCFHAEREGGPFPSPEQIVEASGSLGKSPRQAERNEISDKAYDI